MSQHSRSCSVCDQTFGNAWGGIARIQHMWEVHGIPGHTTFNGHVVQFPPLENNKNV